MTTRPAKVIVLLIFETLFGFAAVKVNTLPHAAISPTHASVPTSASAASGNDNAQRPPIIWERWSVVIGALQTVALVVTFCIMIFVAVRQLRAYVSVTVNFMQSFDGTSNSYGKAELANTGVTPARNLWTAAVVAAFEYPLPEGFMAPKPKKAPTSKTSIFPTKTVVVRFWTEKPFTAQEIAEIVAGTKRIYAYGVTTYTDVFGRCRQTHFGASLRADKPTLLKLTTAYAADDLTVTFEHAQELNHIT